MSLKDIDKLKEKVDKDPNSKLFVPLAEEYKKEGMLDEAIGVLLSGIGKQPGYMSARVSLGKIYVAKEMLKEAQAEFEQVIRSIPDNLYAHKKLADIYRATGDNQQAIRAYRTVLKLNAMDEEALISLSELEGMDLKETNAEKQAAYQQPAEAVVHSPESAPEPAQETAEVAEEEPDPLSGFAAEPSVDAETIRQEDLAAFQSAIFGAAPENPDESPDDLLAAGVDSYDAVAGVIDTEMTVTGNADEETAGVFELDDIEEDDFGQCLPSEGSAAAVFTLEQTTHEQTIPAQRIPEQSNPVPATVTVITASAATLADADRQVSESNYGGALKIYRALLAATPGDCQILQRVEELRQLLKMLGKDKEVLIDQLNSFMTGVEKRRDEFRRNT